MTNSPLKQPEILNINQSSTTSQQEVGTSLMVLVAGARTITHIPSMKNLETNLKIPVIKIRRTIKQITTLTTQYAHSMIFHKQRLENKQHVADLQGPP